MGENEEKVDYLEVDDSIPGQNYVCLSFVSPESMIESKESFKVAKFLQSVCKDKDMDFKRVMEQYKDFTYKFSDELQKDFDEQNDFKTNIRGLKVRGTYTTKEEAEKRAKKLQGLDSEFHVFVGQVGYWLPWDPCADKIEDESFINSQLNDMMEKYKENNVNKDIFYEEQKRDKIKAAKEEAIRKKKEQMEQEKLENVKEEEVEEKEVEEKEVEVIQEVVGEDKECCKDGTVDDCCKEEPCDECTNKDVEESVPTTDVEEAVPEPVVESGPEPEPEPVVEETKEPVVEPEPVVEETKEPVVEPEPEPEPEIKTSPELEGGKLDGDLKQSLEDVDPWMANKLKEKDA